MKKLFKYLFIALFFVPFFTGYVFAAAYTCPAYVQYSGCNSGYYMTASASSTACSPTPAVGNDCRPCSVYGSNYTCAGGTACPVLACTSDCSANETRACTTTCPGGYNAVAGTETRVCSLGGDGCYHFGSWAGCTARCDPVSVNCAAGTFMWWWNGDARTICESCHPDYYCGGGTNIFGSGGVGIANSAGVMPIQSCPADYRANTNFGKKTINECGRACSLSAPSDAYATGISYATMVYYPSACPTTYTITGCAAGYYLASPGDQKCTPVGSGYYSAAGATTRTACPGLIDATNGYHIHAVGNPVQSDAGAADITSCFISNVNGDWWMFERENKGYWRSNGKCYYGANKRYTTCTSPKYFSECFTGYFIDDSKSFAPGHTNNCSPCAAGTYTEAVFYDPLIGVNTSYQYQTSCTPCATNTYSTTPMATSASACLSCPSGLLSPSGSDEAADCGRKLHFGPDQLYLRSVKKTTPSLTINIGGSNYYGNMSTGSVGTLRINSGGITYSVFDDSM